ncbi:hypothetical protein DYGSA30_41150 [Dyella sp. GSA-30]|nr:hypothetical protein DYGSA30_41150 [Dyella sp. GSA-30]
MTTNEVITDQAAPESWTYTPAFFIDTQAEHQSFPVARVLYASMKNRDLAVLELDATYADLSRLNVAPMRLQTRPSYDGMPIELVQIPVVGVPQDEKFMRYASCSARRPTDIYENYSPWFWKDAVANDCAGVSGGTSGSPVMAEGVDRVVGVLNTTVDRGYTGCGPGRPCEVAGSGHVAREGASYYIPVDTVALALTPQGELDIHKLDQGDGIPLQRLHSGWDSQSCVPDEAGACQVPRRDLAIDPQFELIRYKEGLATETICADEWGYGLPLSVETQPLETLAMQPVEGIHMLCAVGKRAGSDIWQSVANATMQLRKIDDTPPAQAPVIDVPFDEEDRWQVTAREAYHDTQVAVIKFGPSDETDCQDMDGYRWQRRGMLTTLAKSGAPWRFCAYGLDSAGNASPIGFRDFR